MKSHVTAECREFIPVCNLKLRAHVSSATRLSCHWSSAPSSKRGRPYLQQRDRLQEGGEPQVGEVICGKLPHLTCKRDHIKMRDYMDRLITPPKRVTSPTSYTSM